MEPTLLKGRSSTEKMNLAGRKKLGETGAFYGRNQETDLLYQWLVLANQDKNIGFIQVEGESGVGKTSLVQQVLQRGKTSHCFQLYGKHDQRIEKVPYYGNELPRGRAIGVSKQT